MFRAHTVQVVNAFNLLNLTFMKPPLQFSLRMIVFYIIFQASTFNAFSQNWNQIIKVTAKNNGGASARSIDDRYGYSVAISGNYAIVGAFQENTDGDGLNSILSAGAAYILFNNAGNWTQIKKITAPTRAVGDVFGISVSIDGEYAVVGAFHEDQDALENNFVLDAGSAYIFKKDQGGTDNWGQVRKIAAPIRADADQFGSSVSISGDYVIVGAFNEDEDADELNTLNDSGSAYLFKMDEGGTDNWGLIKKICAGTRAADDWFGGSVSISGDYAVLGAYREDEDALEANTLSASGSAYIFKKDQGGTDNWGQLKKITATIRASNDTFGSSVAIDGGYIIVGAPSEKEDAFEANALNAAGAAYIFKKDQGGTDNWGQVKKIVPAFRAANDFFSSSVSLSGSYAVVGAVGESEDAQEANTLNRAGGAYIFGKSQGGAEAWGQVQKLAASTRGIGDDLGIAVSISGASVIVGAWLEDEDALDANTISNTGSAYIFETSDPLPVALTTFEGVKNEGQALLSWATTMESNSDYFDIQKSTDGFVWKALGRVLAGVKSDQLRRYSFIDNNPWEEDSPAYENLYRLKMVDLDGRYAYSKMISLPFAPNQRAMLYPNPVYDQLYCNPAYAAKIESISITNSAGRMMLKTIGDNKAAISVNGLIPGIYMAQIRKKSGLVQFQKIVVAR
jgi:hypothetical protein